MSKSFVNKLLPNHQQGSAEEQEPKLMENLIEAVRGIISENKRKIDVIKQNEYLPNTAEQANYENLEIQRNAPQDTKQKRKLPMLLQHFLSGVMAGFAKAEAELASKKKTAETQPAPPDKSKSFGRRKKKDSKAKTKKQPTLEVTKKQKINLPKKTLGRREGFLSDLSFAPRQLCTNSPYFQLFGNVLRKKDIVSII